MHFNMLTSPPDIVNISDVNEIIGRLQHRLLAFFRAMEPF